MNTTEAIKPVAPYVGGKPCGQCRSCASCARGIPYIPVHNFATDKVYLARFDITKLAPMLEDLHSCLTWVVIECLPYQDFIRRYDSDNTLFYLDPPYYRCEHYYGKDLFSRDDFSILSELLGGIQGRFILSLNYVPEVRKLFKDFTIEAVKTRYSVNKGKQKEAGEVLISN